MSNLVVQTNVLALNSHRNLKVIGKKQEVASARLSSGYRINSAADDAAGLAISEKMRAQIRGLDMASKNSQDGISLIQTAEGGMQEIDNMIQRIRELVVQAANDTNDYATNDRKKLQDEIDQLTQGIDAMAGQVEFNHKKLIDGSLTDSQTRAKLLGEVNGKLIVALGASASLATNATGAQSVTLLASYVGAGSGTLGQFASSSAGSLAAVVSSAVTITGAAGATMTASTPTVAVVSALASGDLTSVNAFDTYLAGIDTYLAGLTTIAGMGGDVSTQTATANSVKDSALKVYAALQQAAGWQLSGLSINKLNGTGLWFQTGANSEQGIKVGIGSVRSDVLGIGDGSGGSKIKTNQPKGIGVSGWVDVVDDALQYVTSQRALLGAVQNRLEYTKSSLDISSENLSASESRIRDTDMAKEMMRLTAANVLQQAGVSMLAQANQGPQSVLQLLR